MTCYNKLLLVHNTPYANCTDGELKLVGGSTSSEGTVQVCFNHAWGTISGYVPMSYLSAQTICNALGYTKTGIDAYLKCSNLTCYIYRCYSLQECSLWSRCWSYIYLIFDLFQS